MGKLYGRAVFFRYGSLGPEVLMQQNGKMRLLFPGGEEEPKDGDSIEAIVRELREETQVRKGLLSNIRKYDLLWGSRILEIYWGNGNKDALFVMQWYESYTEFQLPNEPEITGCVWVPLLCVLWGMYENRLYDNVREACIRLLPMIVNWTDPLESRVFIPIDPRTLTRIAS